MITLCAISPLTQAKPQQILDLLASCTQDFVLLPGAIREFNMPSKEQIQTVLASGVHVFVEEANDKFDKKANPPRIVTASEIRSLPKQIFSTRPTEAQIRILGTSLSQRTVAIGNRRITFVLCGEINGFNRDGRLKFGETPQFDIIAHPVHTPMGRWHVLGPKLAALSRTGTVLHAANNTKGPQITTQLRIYRKGQRVMAPCSNNANGTIQWMELEC